MPDRGGELAAEFAVRGGRTVLVQRYHTSPLKIAKTFRVENKPSGSGGAAVMAPAADGVNAPPGAVVAPGAEGFAAVGAGVKERGGSLSGDASRLAPATPPADGGSNAAGPSAGEWAARIAAAAGGGSLAGASADGARTAAAGGTARGEQVAVYVMDCSPGLMDGDRYELSWHLQPGAHVYVTNQSFTKVHPAGTAGGATQRQTIRLARDAVLEYMPEPVMLYEDAAFAGETDVHLAEGSVLMLADVLCPGRAGRGELFRYRRYANRLRVWHGEQLIYAQHQRIEPAAMRLAAPGGWERETHLGTLCVFAEPVGPQHVEAVLACLDALGADRLRYGASLTYRHGLLVSVLGGSAWELQRALTAAWQRLRALLLGCGPLALGK